MNNEIYHIVLRGLDNNLIFKDIDDHYRGVFSLYEFNNSKPVSMKTRRRKIRVEKISGIPISDNRELLVRVFAFCLIPNHIHLLVEQIGDGGITRFMQKLGCGYAGYFNRRHTRKGYVFQNRFVSVPIEDDNQLKTVFVYIHTNPVSLIEPNWKEAGISGPEKAIQFIENYKWSSYQDYIDKKNFPSVTDRNFILNVMGDGRGCKELVDSWIKYKGELKEFPALTLD